MSTEEINTTSLSNESQKDLSGFLKKCFFVYFWEHEWNNGDLRLRQVHEKILALDFEVMIRTGSHISDFGILQGRFGRVRLL
uniref:Uncharacterized protein n=1 Tax=Rhizophagus irregularis (strain DAOM 181602 / DAOM 197198 / MUCL 43194) TaxID=747089 RepID=U9UDE6_RHIID